MNSFQHPLSISQTDYPMQNRDMSFRHPPNISHISGPSNDYRPPSMSGNYPNYAIPTNVYSTNRQPTYEGKMTLNYQNSSYQNIANQASERANQNWTHHQKRPSFQQMNAPSNPNRSFDSRYIHAPYVNYQEERAGKKQISLEKKKQLQYPIPAPAVDKEPLSFTNPSPVKKKNNQNLYTAMPETNKFETPRDLKGYLIPIQRQQDNLTENQHKFQLLKPSIKTKQLQKSRNIDNPALVYPNILQSKGIKNPSFKELLPSQIYNNQQLSPANKSRETEKSFSKSNNAERKIVKYPNILQKNRFQQQHPNESFTKNNLIINTQYNPKKNSYNEFLNEEMKKLQKETKSQKKGYYFDEQIAINKNNVIVKNQSGVKNNDSISYSQKTEKGFLKNYSIKEENGKMVQNLKLIQNQKIKQVVNSASISSKKSLDKITQNQMMWMKMLNTKTETVQRQKLQNNKLANDKAQLLSLYEQAQKKVKRQKQQYTKLEERLKYEMQRQQMLIKQNERLKTTTAMSNEQRQTFAQKQNQYKQTINNLKQTIIKNQPSQNKEVLANINQIVNSHLRQTEQLKTIIENKQQQISYLKEKHIEVDNNINDLIQKHMLQIQYLKVEMNHIASSKQINIIQKENTINTLQRAMESLQSKLRAAVGEIKEKDTFVNNFIIGCVQKYQDKEYMKELMKKYQLILEKSELRKKLIQQTLIIKKLQQEIKLNIMMKPN